MTDQLIYDVSMHEASANFVVEILQKNGLSASIKESRPYNDIILGELDSMQKFEVFLPGKDFEQADEILKAALQKNNYYQQLEEETNEALLDIAGQPAHQNRLQFLAAQFLLKQRNIAIPEINPASPEIKKIRSLPDISKGLLLLVSISGFGFILPGIGGIVLGLFFLLFQVHDQQGQLYPAFDKDARNFGIFLSLFSIGVMAAGWFFFTMA